MMENEWCCGGPLLDLGDANGIVELAKHNLRMIEEIGADKVLFLCPHCQETFQTVYPQVTERELDFELISITKYLNELIGNNVLKPSKPLPYSISYHDPCYLGRYLGDFKSARGIFSKIPKIDFVEMERNREDSYCCGAGGGARILDQDNSTAIGQERAKDFKKTGADVLVASCPLCKTQFRELSQYASKEIIVKDAVEVLRDSLE